jgi:hypothetical protein
MRSPKRSTSPNSPNSIRKRHGEEHRQQVVAVKTRLPSSAVKSVKAGVFKEHSTGILNPFDTEPLRIALTSVVADDDNNGKVNLELREQGRRRGRELRLSGPNRPNRTWY